VSWRLAERVRRYGPANATMCSVLEALAWHGNDDGTECRPGLATVAHFARVSERTAQHALTRLRRDGWTVMERHSSGGQSAEGGLPTCWRVVLDSLMDASKHTPLTASVSGETHADHRLETHADHRLETHAAGGVLLKDFDSKALTRARARRAGSDGRPGAARKGADADRSRPTVPIDTTAARAAIRADDADDAASCPRHCDQGWVTHPDGTVTRCDHTADTTNGSTP
jgi:hypothetical protein